MQNEEKAMRRSHASFRIFIPANSGGFRTGKELIYIGMISANL